MVATEHVIGYGLASEQGCRWVEAQYFINNHAGIGEAIEIFEGR